MHFFLGNRKLVKADEESAAEGLEGLAKAVDGGMNREDMSRSLLARAKPYNQQSTVAGFGDSFTAFVSSHVHWFTYNSSGALTYTDNHGIAGNTTQNMLDRMSDVDGYDVVTLLETANDAAQGITGERHAINMKAIILDQLNKGTKPVFVYGSPYSSAAEALLVSEYNVRDYVTCIDLGVEGYDIFSEYSDGNGQWASGTDADGIHPTDQTKSLAGAYLYEQYSANGVSIPLNMNNNYGLIANPLFMNVTGDTPDSWTVAGVATSVVAESSLGIGNTLTLSATNGFGYAYTSFDALDVGKEYLVAMKINVDFISNDGTGQVDVYLQEGSDSGKRAFILQDCYVSSGEITLSRRITAEDELSRLYVIANGTAFEVNVNAAQVTLFCIDDHRVTSGAEYTVNGETKYLP